MINVHDRKTRLCKSTCGLTWGTCEWNLKIIVWNLCGFRTLLFVSLYNVANQYQTIQKVSYHKVSLE